MSNTLESIAIRDAIQSTRRALHLALNQVAQIEARVNELEESYASPLAVITPLTTKGEKYFVAFEAAPTFAAGIYRGKAAFAKAIEARQGTYSGVPSESITVHQAALAHPVGFKTIKEADECFFAKKESQAIHHW